MRQRVSDKTARRLARETGLPVLYALVRGNTGHRYDLFCDNGIMYYYHRGHAPVPSEYRRDASGRFVDDPSRVEA